MRDLTHAKSDLSFDALYMRLAHEVAKKSKDPSTQVGCYVVSPDKRLNTFGYNGFPAQIPDYKAWLKNRDMESFKKHVDFGDFKQPLFCKYDLILHAETNAILNARRDLTNWTLYCTHHPCSNCALLILTAGIKRVIFHHQELSKGSALKLSLLKAKRIFNMADIPVLQWDDTTNTATTDAHSAHP